MVYGLVGFCCEEEKEVDEEGFEGANFMRMS